MLGLKNLMTSRWMLCPSFVSQLKFLQRVLLLQPNAKARAKAWSGIFFFHKNNGGLKRHWGAISIFLLPVKAVNFYSLFDFWLRRGEEGCTSCRVPQGDPADCGFQLLTSPTTTRLRKQRSHLGTRILGRRRRSLKEVKSQVSVLSLQRG